MVNDVFQVFPNATLRASSKINRDHLACLVSFRTIPTKKMILLYAGEFRVPLRVSASGPEPCGGS